VTESCTPPSEPDPRYKDPDFLLSLPLIPPRCVKTIPAILKPGAVSNHQRGLIKRALNMRKNQAFNRCRGKSGKRLKALAQQGDESHFPSEHKVCQECRCENFAGFGTKGDFYGIGVETGTLGVGYCRQCLTTNNIPPSVALQIAKRDMEMMQKVGTVQDNTGYGQKVAKHEAALARQGVEVRRELQVLDETLDEVLDLIKREKEADSRMAGDLRTLVEWLEEHNPPPNPDLADDDHEEGRVDSVDILEWKEVIGRAQDALLNETTLTKYEKGRLVPFSFADKVDYKVKVARALTKDTIDGLKMSRDKFVSIDALRMAVPELTTVLENAVRTAEAITTQKLTTGECEAGATPVVDYVMNIAGKEWYAIWKKVQSQVGKTGGK